MNYRLCCKYLGHFSIAIAMLMIPSALWAIWFREWGALQAFFMAITVASLFGISLALFGNNAKPQLFQREALCLVSVSWIVAAGIGALPYFFAGIFGPIDAYFESMSGFTTTGSTVMTEIELTPKSILFWRSFTHWLGGMGIIMLFIAVLPYLGAGGKQMFKSESPGPDPQGLRPRIKDTASILYKIYFGLTVAQTLILMIAGMNLFDALCHTFGTLATGGFSTHQASVAHFQSIPIEIIIFFFMVCAGSNFALYFAMLRGNIKAPWKDTEWRTYMAILIIGSLLVTANLLFGQWNLAEGQAPKDYSIGQALRYASFQVVSIMTTTGFCTDDFDIWPNFSRMFLVVLMFVGGCAGSTGGGIKVVRIIILLKMAYWRLERTFRPKTIRAIRISDHVIDNEAQHTVYAFFFIYLTMFALGSMLMSALGMPFQTAATSVIATLNNIGPGLELVGASSDFSAIPAIGKVFLSLCMVMGRLELISVMVLFVPSFWRAG